MGSVRLGAFLAVSLALHVATLWTVAAVVEAPTFDFEFHVPDDVEFGITEGFEVGALDDEPMEEAPLVGEVPEESAAPAEGANEDVADEVEPPEASPEESGEAEEGAALDGGVADAGADGGLDAGVDAGGDAGADAGAGDASADAETDAEADAETDGDAASDAETADADRDAGADAATDAGDAGALLAENGEAEASDERDGEGAGTGTHQAGERIPSGAQIAIRVDFAAVRASPLGPQVRRLVGRIPYWRRLLDGSGIDVVEDLDQLMVASPDPRSIERVVIAGRLREGFRGPSAVGTTVHAPAAGEGAATGSSASSSVASTAASTAASTSGTATGEGAASVPAGVDPAIAATVAHLQALRVDRPVEWRRLGRVPYAPWRSRDPTERVLAALGPQRFAICRPEDLRRVLALAEVRGRRTNTAGTDALLALDPGVVYAIEIEGLRRYVGGAAAVRFPGAALAELRETPSHGVALHARGDFPTADEAEAAAEYWGRQRDRAMGSPLVALSGAGALLSLLEFEAEEETLNVRATLSQGQAQLLLNLLIRLFPADDAAGGITGL